MKNKAMKHNTKAFLIISMISVSLALTACDGDRISSSNPTPVSSPISTIDTSFPLKELKTVRIGTVVVDGLPASKDIRLWQDIEKQTNVHVDFQDVNQSQWNDKKGLMFASNDLPEALIGHGLLTDVELVNYGARGALIPLEELIDQHAPNVKKAFQDYPELKKQITAPDGHIYAIPSFIDDWQAIQAGMILYVNKLWLDKLGMKPPTTTEEFEQVLRAFKEKDPGGVGKDNVIPFTTFKDQSYFSNLFGSFGFIDHYSASGESINHIGLKDGKAIYALAQQEYKEAINYFAKLSAQGLIDKEVFTHDIKAYNAKLKTTPRVVGAFINWRSISWANTTEQQNDFVPVGVLKGPKGDQHWEKYSNGLFMRGSFAITSKSKQPELLMSWIDNVLSDDNQMQMVNAGRFGDYLEKQSDGTIKVLRPLNPTTPEDRLSNPSNTSRINFMTMSNSKRLVSKTPVFTEKGEYDKLFEGKFAKEVYPSVFFSTEEAEQIQTIGNDINTYANHMYAKWIVNGGIDREWEAYLKKLNEMGLQELLAVYQGAYERMQSSK